MRETFLWIRSMDSGKYEQIGNFAQAFLRTFRRAEGFAMTMAWSCSKPLIDAFGGGAIFETADEWKIYDVNWWVSEMEEKHRRSLAVSPTTGETEGDGDHARGGDTACPAVSSGPITPRA